MIASLPPTAKVLGLLAYLTVEASTFSFGPANLLLNVGTLAFAGYVAIRAGRSKVKDETIKDLRESNEAKDGRLGELRDEVEARLKDIRQIEQGTVLLKQELAASEARYDEQSAYTAEHALTAVMTAMDRADTGHERRHREVMLALRNVQTALERT